MLRTLATCLVSRMPLVVSPPLAWTGKPLSSWFGSSKTLVASFRGRGRASMATQASMTCFVKGDPDNQVLGDCPFCHRVLLTLEEKELDYKKDYVDFNNKPDWLLEVNKDGTVPILKDGDKWVPDSGVIVEYLEEKYPNPAVPADAEGTEAIGGIFKAFREFLFNDDDSKSAGLESTLLEELGKVESLLAARGGQFLGGGSLNAADAALLPRLYHMETALGKYKGWSFPDSLPKLATYYSTASQRTSWKNTDYGKEMILKGWGKHFS